MKRDHQNEQDQEDDGNDSNHSGGQKRFRNNDETLRVLIPSRVSYSVAFRMRFWHLFTFVMRSPFDVDSDSNFEIELLKNGENLLKKTKTLEIILSNRLPVL